MANKYVNFNAPSPYASQQADLERRQRLAELMQQQAMQPIETNNTSITPTQGLAKVLKSYLSAKQLDKINTEQRNIEQNQVQEIDDATNAIAGRLTGRRPTPIPIGGTPEQLAAANINAEDSSNKLVELMKTNAEKNAQPLTKEELQTPLEEVQTTGQYIKDPQDAMRIALTRSGGRALQANPALASMLSQYIPKTPKYADIDPSKYTGDSLKIYQETGDPSLLRPIAKVEKKITETPFSAVLNGKTGMFVHDSEGNIVPVPGLTPYRTPPSGGDSTPLSSEDLGFMARQALSGDPSVFSGLGSGRIGAQNRALLRNKMTEVAKELNISPEQLSAINAQYFGTRAGERTLGTRTANIGLAISEAQQLMPLAIQTSEQVKRTDFPLLNKIIIAGEKNIGDENVVRFGIATNSLINAYARAINPTGISTVSDKEHARKLLETAWSKGQFSAAVDQLNKEMQAAKEAPNKVRGEFRDAITGKNNVVVEYVRDKTGKMVKK